MLFTHEEKNMLVGAFVSGIADLALEGYYVYRRGQGYDIHNQPTDPLYYLYYKINPWIPPVDDLVALLGVPVLLWGLGKYKRSSKLRYMGIGGMVYGFSEIIGWMAVNVARVAAGQPVYSVVYGGS